MNFFDFPVEILLKITNELDVKSVLQLSSVSKMGNFIGKEVLFEKFHSLRPLIRSNFNTSVSSPNASSVMTPTTSVREHPMIDMDAVNLKLEDHKANKTTITTSSTTITDSDHTILQFKEEEKEMDLRVHEDESKISININCQLDGQQYVKTRWSATLLPIGSTSCFKVPMESTKMGYFEFCFSNLGEEPSQFGCYDYEAVYRYKLSLNRVFIDRDLMLTLAERLM